MRKVLDPDEQLGYLLARAADRQGRLWANALRDVAVNPRQFSMLALLAREPGMSQARLARYMMITPQSVSESLAALRGAGLLEGGTVDPGRAARLRLTSAGWKLLERAYPVVEASNRVGFGALTAAEQRTLARLLKKLLA